MIIDAHMHVGVWDHVDFLERQCTVADAIAVMRESGIAGAALVPTDRCDNQGLLDDIRSQIAGGFTGPLWFFPWVRPVETGSAGERDLEWIDDHATDVTGIKIHPSLSRMRVTDDGFAPALELADSHGWVVLVHCGRWQEMASFRFAVEAAGLYSQTKFLLAHAGGDTPPYARAAAELVAQRKLDNVWFEFSGLREYWVIERNVALLGAERYLMGSDYSLAHPLMYLGAIRGMNLNDDQKRRILGLNALELFGDPVSGEAG